MQQYSGVDYKQNTVAQAWSADTRFCVIGAGAAGLTVGVALRERGYRDITVIEREPVVGGKCYTHATVNGFLELGANIVFPGSVVHRLAERTGASIIDWFPIQIFDPRTGDTRAFGSTERNFPLFQFVRAYGRLVAEVLRHRRLRTCGFHACTDGDLMALGASVRSWLAARGLAVIEDALMPFMVGAGLGYPEDEVPTAYFLKMLHFIQSMGISDLLHRRTYRLWVLQTAGRAAGPTCDLLLRRGHFGNQRLSRGGARGSPGREVLPGPSAHTLKEHVWIFMTAMLLFSIRRTGR